MENSYFAGRPSIQRIHIRRSGINSLSLKQCAHNGFDQYRSILAIASVRKIHFKKVSLDGRTESSPEGAQGEAPGKKACEHSTGQFYTYSNLNSHINTIYSFLQAMWRKGFPLVLCGGGGGLPKQNSVILFIGLKRMGTNWCCHLVALVVNTQNTSIITMT